MQLLEQPLGPEQAVQLPEQLSGLAWALEQQGSVRPELPPERLEQELQQVPEQPALAPE